MKDVSVIIPTYNRAKYLDYTLAAFTLQTYTEFELIIIDDGSEDDTFDVIEKYRHHLAIKYIYQKHAGSSSARNNGLLEARGTYIIHIDCDRIPCRSFIEEHLRILINSDHTVSIGFKPLILSIFNRKLRLKYPDLLDYLSKNPNKMNDIINSQEECVLFTPHDLVHDFENIMSKSQVYVPRDNYQDVINIHTEQLHNFKFGWVMATTGNMGYSRKNAQTVKFDEKYKGWGLEDNDFSYQLFKKGFTFKFNMKAINYHQAHERGSNERNEIILNFKYFVEKFKSLEVFLFRHVYSGNLSIVEANSILSMVETLPECDGHILLKAIQNNPV